MIKQCSKQSIFQSYIYQIKIKIGLQFFTFFYYFFQRISSITTYQLFVRNNAFYSFHFDAKSIYFYAVMTLTSLNWPLRRYKNIFYTFISIPSRIRVDKLSYMSVTWVAIYMVCRSSYWGETLSIIMYFIFPSNNFHSWRKIGDK